MVKATIITQIEDGKTIYKVGDRVRVLMENRNEYIGTITEIREESFDIATCDGWLKRAFAYNQISKIRFAKDGESFDNTLNFDD